MLSAPDFSVIEDEIESRISPGGFVFLDTFTFFDPADKENVSTIYSLAMYGTIYELDN